MKKSRNNQGFEVIKFVDRYSQECSIQKSSLVPEDCIWFGVDIDLNGEEICARMHLTQEQVRDILPVLQQFVETGEIR